MPAPGHEIRGLDCPALPRLARHEEGGGVRPGANAVPEAGCSDQIFEEPGPPDFHTRYGVPSVSTNDAGSMEPPSDFWHSSGAVDLSLNGPWGWPAVATEMHSSPLPATSTA